MIRNSEVSVLTSKFLSTQLIIMPLYLDIAPVTSTQDVPSRGASVDKDSQERELIIATEAGEEGGIFGESRDRRV